MQWAWFAPWFLVGAATGAWWSKRKAIEAAVAHAVANANSIAEAKAASVSGASARQVVMIGGQTSADSGSGGLRQRREASYGAVTDGELRVRSVRSVLPGERPISVSEFDGGYDDDDDDDYSDDDLSATFDRLGELERRHDRLLSRGAVGNDLDRRLLVGGDRAENRKAQR